MSSTSREYLSYLDGIFALHPFIVIPCLNEAARLERACASLGFGIGPGDLPAGARLVLVDNGSTDGTADVMDRVRRRSPARAVVCVFEAERGYVPARKKGMAAVLELAAGQALDLGDVLVLQADADTEYGAGYVTAMVRASNRSGATLLEGRSIPPRPREDATAALRSLEAIVDARVVHLLADDRHDVVVDDKVAGFTMSDYLSWGGHQREYSSYPPHEEVFAETSRLFLRARLSGARRTVVDDAEATTSQRRTLEEPALAFATAGYPRDARWKRDWTATYDGARNLEAFDPGAGLGDVGLAVMTRLLHVVGLFGVVPAYVAHAVGDDRDEGLELYRPLLRELEFPSIAVARRRPAAIFERALSIDPRQLTRLEERFSSNR